MLASMPVTMSDSDAVTLHSAKEITVLMPVVLSPADLVRTIRFPSKSVEAPVMVGQQLAEVELSYGDEVYAVVPLVALNSVAASETQIIERDVQSFFTRTEVKIAMIAAVVLVVLVVLWKLTIGKRRYRYGKSVRGRSNYRGRRK
jgi:D-alanyl-D-alanine carboxypeptidase (penicillin-binding protein 5/6)